VKFAFIDAEKAFSVRFMCEQLDVSRSGFYSWKNGSASAHELGDEALSVHIKEIFTETRRRYGAPRVHRELRARGIRVGRKRVARLMVERGLSAVPKRRYVVTTQSNPDLAPSPNIVNQNFDVSRPNEVWVGDITYVATREGWLFLAVLIDLYSRKVVGWATSPRIDTELCLRALSSALENRNPPSGLIHHTDRGCQYASALYRQVLAAHGIRQSMSRKGNCYDNAPSESFFSSMKRECMSEVDFETRADARSEVMQFIEGFYNTERIHSSIGYVSPADYETKYESGLA
jgi:transposase InsO family protein